MVGRSRSRKRRGKWRGEVDGGGGDQQKARAGLFITFTPTYSTVQYVHTVLLLNGSTALPLDVGR